MELPNRQSEDGLELWKKEIIRFKEYLEEYFHIVITDEMVKDAIHLSNENRRAVQRLYGLMKLDPPPMTGKEFCMEINISWTFKRFRRSWIPYGSGSWRNIKRIRRLEESPGF